MKTLAVLLALSVAGWASAGETNCKDGSCYTTITKTHCKGGHCGYPTKYVKVYPTCYGGNCGPQVYLPQGHYAPRIAHRYGLFGRRILRIRY